jgi:release factor glutamine methyltransferase
MSDAVTAGSVREALGGAVDALAAVGVETPRLDAEVLLAEATGLDRARLAANPDAGIPPAVGRRFGEMVRRRLRREPVAYILGRKGFRSIDLAVDRRVLVPRPETELLVDLALELQPRRVLDIGTGSGAIALALASELPGCELIATDTSSAALEVARANAERLGLASRVEFVESTLPPEPSPLDLIVANLPYVAEREWAGLEPEVTRWEPREALLAGPDGLDVLRAAIPLAAIATPALALEVGIGQAQAVSELLFEAGFATVETRADLAGIPRVVWGRRRSWTLVSSMGDGKFQRSGDERDRLDRK